MHQQVSTVASLSSTITGGWRKFSATSPAQHEIVEIRRLNDDRTILRCRTDLRPSFDWRHAEWRPL